MHQEKNSKVNTGKMRTIIIHDLQGISLVNDTRANKVVLLSHVHYFALELDKKVVSDVIDNGQSM